MKKRLVALILCGVMTMGVLAGCGSSSANLAGVYATSAAGEYEYGGAVLGTECDGYDLKLYSDNSYVLTVTTTTIMSDTAAGVISTTVYGTYTKEDASNGYVPVTLSAASRIVYASNSTLGGYAFDYDTDEDTEYIIPGGDDSIIDKNTFIEQLGYSGETTVYIALDSSNNETSTLSFEAQ